MLWREVTRDVKRLRKGARPAKAKSEPVRSATPPHAPPPSPAIAPAAAKPRRAAGFGLDGATAERLKRGKVEPEATLDLHGMTQAAAHAALAAFLRSAHERGRRCVLVVTGKGSPAEREPVPFSLTERPKAGVLKANVPRWLEEAEMRSAVAGVQSAHQRHGGAGALYVYLRRRRG